MIYLLIFISIFLSCCGIYLAKTLRDSEEKIKELEDENAMLKLELEESKAKEGKGILESTIDGICKALNNFDFSSALLSSQKSIDEYSSTVKSIMNQEDVENDTM